MSLAALGASNADSRSVRWLLLSAAAAAVEDEESP